MSRATETRLGKLEVRAGVAGRRVFIFGAVEPGKAKRRERIASGEARGDDLFIFYWRSGSRPAVLCALHHQRIRRVGAIAHARPAQGLCDRRAAAWDRPGRAPGGSRRRNPSRAWKLGCGSNARSESGTGRTDIAKSGSTCALFTRQQTLEAVTEGQRQAQSRGAKERELVPIARDEEEVSW